MTTTTTLAATPRTAVGSSAAKRLRRDGHIPAVAYGKNLPTLTLAVSPKEVLAILKSERGKNSVLSLDCAGKQTLVMIREYTYHPVTRALQHIDFIEVHLDKEVDVEVPLIVTGKPIGVTQGGVLRQVFRTLPVRCLPDRIPLKLECDSTPLELGDHISTQQLTLPQGVTIRLPAEQTLVAIVAPEAEKPEEDEAAVAAAAAAATPAAGAAPAAGGAAPAAGGAAPAKDAKAAPAKDDKKKK